MLCSQSDPAITMRSNMDVDGALHNLKKGGVRRSNAVLPDASGHSRDWTTIAAA
jgi:hypothetical protein